MTALQMCIRDRLIGETFEYAPEFNYIINGLLMRYENCPYLIMFLRENTKLIIATFNKSGTRNLRILKHSLTNFKKIFDMVNNYYPNTNHRVLQTMLIFTIAISFEIKAGKITKDKFVNINDKMCIRDRTNVADQEEITHQDKMAKRRKNFLNMVHS